MAKVLISRLTDPFLTKAVRSLDGNQSPTVQLQSYRNVAGIRNLDYSCETFPRELQRLEMQACSRTETGALPSLLGFLCSFLEERPRLCSISLLASYFTPQNFCIPARHLT